MKYVLAFFVMVLAMPVWASGMTCDDKGNCVNLTGNYLLNTEQSRGLPIGTQMPDPKQCAYPKNFADALHTKLCSKKDLPR